MPGGKVYRQLFEAQVNLLKQSFKIFIKIIWALFYKKKKVQLSDKCESVKEKYIEHTPEVKVTQDNIPLVKYESK